MPDTPKRRSVVAACSGLAALAGILFALAVARAVAGQAQYYRTTGEGKIQTCSGLGIERCSYENIELPSFVDQLRADSNIWHEKKSDRLTMCYEEIENGIFTKKLLMFQCEPLDGPR